MRSTPTPFETLRTVNVSLTPPPRRAIHTPSNACNRSFSPSTHSHIDSQRVTGAKRGNVRAQPRLSRFR